MPLDPTDVTGEHVREFIADQLDHWKPTTAHLRYRSLKTFYRWCVDEGELETDPMARVKPPKLPDELVFKLYELTADVIRSLSELAPST